MLGLLENQLLDLLKASPLGRRLKTVDSLPDTPDKDVLKRWGVEAPAAYVVALDGDLDDSVARPQFVVVLVARNARSHQAARHGDGRSLGLYEMLDAAIGELNGGKTPDANWRATRYQFMREPELRDQGLHAALVLIETTTDAPTSAAGVLGDFLAFHADFDLAPHAPAEYPRWLQDDHGDPAPDMQSHINPQEGT